MLDEAHVSRWLDAYVSAWRSHDSGAIGALFSDDVEYRFYPGEEPLRGREQVVAWWLDQRDPEDAYDGEYSPVAIDGEVAVASGTSMYYTEPGGPVDRVYDNCFVMRFDADGRCREFTEWYVLRGRRRLVLKLGLVEGLSAAEIAGRIGVPRDEVAEILRGAASGMDERDADLLECDGNDRLKPGRSTMDRADVTRWLEGYVSAWKSYDREAIGELFSEDVTYFYRPFDEPLRGREEVVESWFDDPDRPGTYEADYAPVAVDGNVAVAAGTSTYTDPEEIYENCFLLEFDGDGRCSKLTEWYVKRPDA